MDPDSPLTPQLLLNLDSNDAELLRDLGLPDLLEHDPRPTFVLDATNENNSAFEIRLAFCNAAFAAVESGALESALDGGGSPIGKENAASFSQFRQWACCNGLTSRIPKSFGGYNWRRFLIAKRWIVINGTPTKAARVNQAVTEDDAPLSRTHSKASFTTFDWTDDPPPVKLSSHVAWARSIDWANTPLGPMKGWSPQLRSNASLIMQDPRPAVGFYGQELIMIYNEPYIELLGDIHPCMGRSAREALAPIWDEYFEPIIVRNIAGETVDNSHTEIPLNRNGFVEETYFSTRFIPIFNSEGATIGHYEPVVEITKEVILERRSRTLLELSQELPRARDSDTYWDHAAQVFSSNQKDVPFALFYSNETADKGMEANTDSSGGLDRRCQFRHRRSTGLLDEPPSGFEILDIRLEEGINKFLKQAIIADRPIAVDIAHDLDRENLAEGLQPLISGDICRSVVICPLRSSSLNDTILGFMILGLNPRRPYDQAYSQFVYEATRLVSASLDSLILHEEDIGRREHTAELIKTELRQQLVESQKKADRGHSKFQRFAERSDIGIFIIDAKMEGIYSYRNEAWFSICGTKDRTLTLAEAWDVIVDDEYAVFGKTKFEALRMTKKPHTWSVSSSTGVDDSPSEEQKKWVLCSIFPELSDEGEILELVGCITEISRQKWGEQLQAVQATQARESKRQLESFIDTTSHEMRNPLSAIVQCADSIIASHKILEQASCCDENYQRTLLATVDSAETIVQCSKHMKTIVDDVLTISKLDSGLFAMTPIDVQLESTVRDAVKMFEGEARSAGIDLEFSIEDSCREFGIVDISLDPTRVLQILINLITNAIKFTRLEAKRHILVGLSLSLERPTHDSDGRVEYIPRTENSEAKTLLEDWEKGRNVFVRFSVQDTGTGMTDEQHHLLFTRFSQASPRTHIDYGGTGLGLFISRRLCEMHGGAIGFTSEKGVGSTFSFYVQSRQSLPTSFGSGSVERCATTVDSCSQTHGSFLRSTSYNKGNTPPSSGIVIPENIIPENIIPDSDLHVLIVEDNLVNQRVLAKQLRNLGMNIAVANHGGEALEYLQTTKFCIGDESGTELTLILLDWEMPVMNGLECVTNIRKMQEEGRISRHVPVIGVTANVRSEQVGMALRAGMDNVISKPFRIPELRDCIQKTLRVTSLARSTAV
ncbi:aerobic respiration control sensor protein-like protein arcB [Boeremia exigua]|uniref:aerobic respiration control sensor protein-like protein arcB n=1 Tax=Boeremia exigua TaxID=749465 RepID=UPI001E8D4BFC|nr:aerobic respiration control sensor protein-like protein arcB [Boeremia exigua]KAH6639710.1 aerobic respiration control sensor protein-like protein arcB [Boeremia exigua]